jgi:hypothetical protein
MCGGAQFLPNASHMIRKQMVNVTLMTGHQANLAHCYKFHILQQIFSKQYLGLGKTTKRQD